MVLKNISPGCGVRASLMLFYFITLMLLLLVHMLSTISPLQDSKVYWTYSNPDCTSIAQAPMTDIPLSDLNDDHLSTSLRFLVCHWDKSMPIGFEHVIETIAWP